MTDQPELARGWTNPAHGNLTRPDPDYQLGGRLASHESPAFMLEKGYVEQVTIWNRLEHFTWAWFTLPMATGGIALLLTDQPHTFHGLLTIGKIIYIFDLVIFTVLTSLICLRFVRQPWKFRSSITSPTEGLFLATWFLSIPTIVGGMHNYGGVCTGYWLQVVLRVLFWLYVAVTFLIAVFQYWYLFTGVQLTLQSMTPAWLLPVFPIMLSGTIASVISVSQPDDQRLPILVAGVVFQGLGFWVAILIYAIYITRMMECGLPGPNLRPGMFIAVGPPCFTGLAFIGMSRAIPRDYGYFASHPTAAETLGQLALIFAIFIWGLAFWFFCLSLFSVLTAMKRMSFHLIWYALVFPNVGFTIAIISIGNSLESNAVQWVGSILTIILVGVWLFVMAAHARALWRGDILWPGRDEDKDEVEPKTD